MEAEVLMVDVTVRVGPDTVTASYTVPVPPTTPSNPDATLPAINEVAWASLAPAAGEHLGKTLGRMITNARVVMPATSPGNPIPVIDDVAVNNYGVFAPKALGLRGAGVDKTIVQVKANSYTFLVARPKSAGSGVLRFGPNNSSTRIQTSLSGMTWIGTDQSSTGPGASASDSSGSGVPMYRAGLMNYYGQDAVWQDLKLIGMSRGGGNSPNTGETFAINSFHDINSRYLRVEVDGRDSTLTTRIGGSPFGCNGSKNVYLEDCYFHDSQFSGLTFSYAGSLSSPTDTITSLRVTVSQNANHPNVGSGGRFSGLNHEQVIGAIKHTQTNITLDQANLWDSSHMSFGCDASMPDNKAILIDSPTWHGLSPTWANGAFTVKLWGGQVTPPVVKNPDGSLKQPVIVAGQNPPKQNIDPTTQFAVSVGTGYVAP